MSSWIANAVRMMVTRAKVVGAQLGPRSLLQVARFANETGLQSIELLLPPGYVALPVAGADVTILHVGGLADHKVAIGGDNVADRVADLAPGEIGLSRGGTQRVILRNGYIEIVDPVQVKITAPSLLWSPDGVIFYRLVTETGGYT